MESVVLRFVCNGEYLNFLESDNLDVSLEEIRKRLKRRVFEEDILPGPFKFLFKGVAISQKQEARLSVRQICFEPPVMSNQIKSLKTSKSVFDISVRFDDTPSISTSQTVADI